MRHAIRALLLGLACASPALAQNRPSARPAAEDSRQAQAQARVEAARRVQQADALFDAALERQHNAEAAARHAEAEAASRARTFTAMLPVLRRLALYPAETLLAQPTAPEEALRGTLVLRALARQLREEAEQLREAREIAAQTAAQAAMESDRLAIARTAAREAAIALDTDLASRPPAAPTREAERAQQAAARAADLPDMIARLPRDSAPGRPESAPHALPVSGRITRDFGAPTEAGPARGLTIAAPPGARVTAPCAGRIAFAGPFRSYGQLMILDCGDALHAVLAGMARLDFTTGDRILAGEPLGILGEPDPRTGRAALYLELRRHGAPTDPRPWLSPRS